MFHIDCTRQAWDSSNESHTNLLHLPIGLGLEASRTRGFEACHAVAANGAAVAGDFTERAALRQWLVLLYLLLYR